MLRGDQCRRPIRHAADGLPTRRASHEVGRVVVLRSRPVVDPSSTTTPSGAYRFGVGNPYGKTGGRPKGARNLSTMLETAIRDFERRHRGHGLPCGPCQPPCYSFMQHCLRRALVSDRMAVALLNKRVPDATPLTGASGVVVNVLYPADPVVNVVQRVEVAGADH